MAVVEAELRARIGTEPFAIVGNSFGGMIARRVAHDFRDQVLGLALLAPVMVASHEQRVVPEHVVLSADAELVEEFGDAGDDYAEMSVVQSRENFAAFREYVQPSLLAADQAALERISGRYSLEVEPEVASAAPFTQPTLFLTGRQDQVVGYQDGWDRVEHYPRATFAVLDAAGHNLHLDQPALTRAHMTEWLARVVTQSSE